jgi:hypothetical protein
LFEVWVKLRQLRCTATTLDLYRVVALKRCIFATRSRRSAPKPPVKTRVMYGVLCSEPAPANPAGEAAR